MLFELSDTRYPLKLKQKILKSSTKFFLLLFMTTKELFIYWTKTHLCPNWTTKKIESIYFGAEWFMYQNVFYAISKIIKKYYSNCSTQYSLKNKIENLDFQKIVFQNFHQINKSKNFYVVWFANICLFLLYNNIKLSFFFKKVCRY